MSSSLLQRKFTSPGISQLSGIKAAYRVNCIISERCRDNATWSVSWAPSFDHFGRPSLPTRFRHCSENKKKKKLSDHQARRIGDEIPPLTRPSTSVVMTLRGGQPGLSSLLVRGILAGFPSPRPAAATEIWSHSAVVTQNENRGGGRRRRGGGQGQGGERQTVCGNRALLGLWRGLAGEDDDVVKAPLHSAQHLTQQLAAVASSFYMAKWVETHERGGPMDQLREHYCQKSCPYKSIIQNRRKSHKKIYQWKNDV